MEHWTECVGFETNSGNTDKNWARHGVADFECEEVFFNQPLALRNDPKHSQGEARYFALGRTDQDRLLFAAFKVRRQLIRIISARGMTNREQRIYEAYREEE